MENKKRIPGFSRYVISEDLTVEKHLTGFVMKPEINFNRVRVKLINDEGKGVWFYPADCISDLFKPEVIELDNFTKDLSGDVNNEATEKTLIHHESVEVAFKPPFKTRTPTKYDFKSMDVHSKRKIHASNKVTVEQVIQIRSDYDCGLKTKKEIALEYGIGWQTAGKICNRVTYKEVPEQYKPTDNAQGEIC